MVNLVSHDCDTCYAKTILFFFHVFTLQTFLVGSYHGLKTFILRSEGQKQHFNIQV
jgi:hypothetical protein